MSANALPVITVHGHASNPGTVTEPTVYEQALARSLSPESLPAHIGVLVDGNRRWAAQRGLSTREGHAAGAERIIDFLAWCTELSIPQVSLYMLSIENLKRPEKELTGLVAVIDAFLVRLVESGRVCALPAALVSDDPTECAEENWPAVGERIRVRRLGVWPGGEMRVSRTMFTDGPVPGPPPSFYASRTNRAPESVIAYTRTLPEAVVDRVREAADAVSARDWDRAEELTSGNRLDWEETDDFMTTYGQPPYTPLPDGFETDMHAAPIHGGGNWIDCLLWTETERPGDVEISLKITPAPDRPDHLNTAIVRMRAIGSRHPGRHDQKPRPQGPGWTPPS